MERKPPQHGRTLDSGGCYPIGDPGLYFHCTVLVAVGNRLHRPMSSGLPVGRSSVAGGKCRIAWRRVIISKELGRLGIVDLRRLGIALRLRWEWLRRTDPTRSWHALPSRSERAVRAFFQVAVHIEVGSGSSTLFWTDRWINGQSIGHIAPALLAAVPKRLRRRAMSSALHGRAWARDIKGPRTVQVILGYVQVDALIRDVHLQPGVEDRFVWRFSTDGVYSASSAYRAMFYGSVKLRGATQLWKAPAPSKVKIFFWLAIHERCWTASRRKKRGLQDCDLCALCHQAPATMNHLLSACV